MAPGENPRHRWTDDYTIRCLTIQLSRFRRFAVVMLYHKLHRDFSGQNGYTSGQADGFLTYRH